MALSSSTTAPVPSSSVPSASSSASSAPRPSVRLSRAPPSRPAKSARIHLTNAQKLELCEYSAAHPGLAWDELAVWAKKRFRLRKPISTSSVYHALRRYESLKQLTPRELEYRNLPKNAVHVQFEARLYEWIVQMADRGLHLDCKIIQAEAQRLRDELDDGSLAKHTFSLGWLTAYMLRHDLSLTNLHKGGSVIAPDRPRRTYKPRAPTAAVTAAVDNAASRA